MLNKCGEGYIQVCVIILALCIVLSVFLTFVYAVNFVRLTERNTKTVLEQYVTKNAIQIYDSIKQGTNKTDAINETEYIENLVSFCSFTRGHSYLYHYSGGDEPDYYISIPTVSFAEHNRLRLILTYTVYVPLRFAGKTVTTAEIPVTVKLNLEGKF